jgi:hypothetical protein
MTRAELQRLVDRLPESVLDGKAQLEVTADDLQALNDVVIELANKLGALTQEWMDHQRRELFGGQSSFG